ncbi:MAG TPA: 2-amino-4-hydroxy-6-hydroxymethyldihydropteridine diphosphokinase [Stellaceae bacterium]|nr:2-amino-4-hydroxy-6-hydroxymethyldihydropteridine diphosphokinase [Stellaceae bacterium]
MILVGLGGNRCSAESGPPMQTLAAALAALAAMDIAVTARSSWYRSEPVPPSAQPWFVNAVAAADTALDPEALLARLLALEGRFGRIRGKRNAARVLDLDLLDYEGRIVQSDALTLPHPRLHERRFVLAPLAQIAPSWRHPRLHKRADELLAALPQGESVYRLP